RRTAGHAQTYLEEGRSGNDPAVDHAARQIDMADVEHLKLRLCADRLDLQSHGGDVRRRVEDGMLTEVHGSDVKAADLRTQLDHMTDANIRRSKSGAWRGLLRIILGGNE